MEASTRILVCKDPAHTPAGCRSCDGTGLLEFDTQTAELRPCRRKQAQWEPLRKPDEPRPKKTNERMY